MKLNKVVLYAGGIIVFLLGMIVFGLLNDLRQPGLEEVLKQKKITDIKNVKIVVNKMDYKLHLFIDTILVKSYDVVFGGNPRLRKRFKEDRYTPIGEYYICEKRLSKIKDRILQINYPNITDAETGLKEKRITQEEFNKIFDDITNKRTPTMYTNLGGNIGIHGNGKYDIILRNLPFILNWTEGGIALDNSEIKELYNVCQVGTKVSIY